MREMQGLISVGMAVAAIQTQVSLNEQATDPTSNTPAKQYLTLRMPSCHLHNPMVDPKATKATALSY
jgi:hypothetical protein